MAKRPAKQSSWSLFRSSFSFKEMLAVGGAIFAVAGTYYGITNDIKGIHDTVDEVKKHQQDTRKIVDGVVKDVASVLELLGGPKK